MGGAGNFADFCVVVKKKGGGGVFLKPFGVGLAWSPDVGGFILTVLLVVLPLLPPLAVVVGPKRCVELGQGLAQSIKLYVYNDARPLSHLHPRLLSTTLQAVAVLPVSPAHDGAVSSPQAGPHFLRLIFESVPLLRDNVPDVLHCQRVVPGFD